MKKFFYKTSKIVIIIIATFCLISIGTKNYAATKNKKSQTVTVKEITFDKKVYPLKNNGDTVKIKASVKPSNANNKKLVWSSSNTLAATVNSSGKVTAQGNGMSTIVAKTKDGTVSAICYVMVGSNINTNRFYYNQLTNMKDTTARDTYIILYKKLYADVLKNDNTINYSKLPNTIELISYTGSENNRNIMNEAFNMGQAGFVFDNPKIFYAEFYELKKDVKGNTCHWYFKLKLPAECNGNKAKLANIQEKIDSTTKTILKEAKKKKNDYEKVKYIHNWIINNTDYDYTFKKDFNGSIYGVLKKDGKVVCRGYAQTFKYLLDKLNIECISVIGTGLAKNFSFSFLGEGHVWNYVKLNKKWYGVDCTWDDTLNPGKISYSYFLRGSNEFRSKGWDSNGMMHMVLDYFKYPTLSSKDYK